MGATVYNFIFKLSHLLRLYLFCYLIIYLLIDYRNTFFSQKQTVVIIMHT